MSSRPLCTAVRADGLRGGEDWPRCIDDDRCQLERRCYWRWWHELENPQPDLFADASDATATPGDARRDACDQGS